MRTRYLPLLAAAASLMLAAPAHAKPPLVQLLSHSVGGGFPNGPSHDPAFSQDRQLATVAAFDSDASNLVKGDGNGHVTDVFVVRRKRPYSLHGPPWIMGKTHLISRGMGGAPANGRSYLPDVDGEQLHAPRCVAFVSEASNLVPGDSDGVADAFVYWLHTGRIERVSAGPGATSEVKVDGHCDRVAFVTDVGGVKQVYVRILGSQGDNTGLRGTTFLASASSSGEAGNDDSSEVAFARSGGGCGRQGRCGDFSGESVFFSSAATNLVPGDTNGVNDVFERTFTRAFVRTFYPHGRVVNGIRTRHAVIGHGPLQQSTRLISVSGSGGPANGPSYHPAANDPGAFVVFQTFATNLFGGDSNGQPDIVRADMSKNPPDFMLVSRRGRTQANGPSDHPSIGRTGQDLFFDSTASNLEPNDKDCTGDVFHLWTVRDITVFTSLDSRNRIPNAPYGTREPCPPVVATPSLKPVTSYYSNYVLYESGYPLLDVPLARRAGIGDNRVKAAQLSAQPSYHQVYLRYLGPR
ncbi:MAG: hypothetical protein ACJ77M_19420 [Thermoleophilaceae bacterium]